MNIGEPIRRFVAEPLELPEPCRPEKVPEEPVKVEPKPVEEPECIPART